MTVDYANTAEAQRNREDKARRLAAHAWRYGLTPDELLSLPDDVARAFARSAEVPPPSDGSPTWDAAGRVLQRMVDGANDPRWTHAAPPHDLAHEAAPWNPNPAPAPEPVAVAPAEPFDPPRGWEAVVALGPVPSGHTCHACPKPAVVSTAHLWRCGDHPPGPGEWGHGLNYARPPQATCAPGRCYCSRCPGYTPMPATVPPRPEPEPRRYR